MAENNPVTRLYGGFRGMDLRGDEVNLFRSPDCKNVWRDYKETDSIRTRPTMELHTALAERIHGIYFYNGVMLVHCGQRLLKVENGETEELGSGLSEAASNGFVYEGIWYFMDGAHYLRYNGVNLSNVEGYVPTTSIGRKPAGGGSVYEDVNMLQPRRINTFLGDGESRVFALDTRQIDSSFPVKVTVDDAAVTGFTVDYEAGTVTFSAAPPAPKTDGQDNVVIEFQKTRAGYAESILGCTLMQVFDNRVFVSGNPEYPNVVWHCSLNDPTYFSDTDYYNEGLDTAGIRGLVAGNNALWVFREPSDANTTVFYHAPTLDADYGKIYPSTHSSVTTGCVGRAINFNDDIVFFSERGMEGISGDITTEQSLAHRSSLADRALIREEGYRDMILAEWEGYLMVFIGKKAFLADSRTAFSNENHMEYEWYYWEMEQEVTCAQVHDGILYLGTPQGVCTLTGSGNLQSWWVTPKDRFGYPNRLKTTNKRGCVAEVTGDVTVYARTDKTEFEWIGQYGGVTDYFVSRVKRKKFKDIQLKFYSDTRFSLETVTLECWIGGYIKR